jgi:hypothetical protein
MNQQSQDYPVFLGENPPLVITLPGAKSPGSELYPTLRTFRSLRSRAGLLAGWFSARRGSQSVTDIQAGDYQGLDFEPITYSGCKVNHLYKLCALFNIIAMGSFRRVY